MESEARFPGKLRFLFSPARYKIAFGGRGSAKSWSYARALLIQGAAQKLRILCAREVQRSIKQSVHTLLTDQIQELGLGAFYEVLESEIRGKNGSTFSFTGLAQHTVESIKSFEGVDRVWVEEAQTVSKKSWDILIPTIRKPGSEIWVSFNPDLETDDTYQRFVVSPPDGAVVQKVNYTDNPWFPEVLDIERRHCKLTRPKDYPNIWEGECRAAAEGAIFADEIIRSHEEKRITTVPYDPQLRVHVVFDLGWNDAMFILLCQRHISELRIIESIEDSHKTLDHYSALLKDKRMNWGTCFLPHDAKHKDYKLGRSGQDIMKSLGWDVEIVPEIGVEQGIRNARMVFNRVLFDKTKAARIIECLKNYKRAVNQITGEPGAPLHDEYSHGADAFRYACIVTEQMTNEGNKDFMKPIQYDNRGIF